VINEQCKMTENQKRNAKVDHLKKPPEENEVSEKQNNKEKDETDSVERSQLPETFDEEFEAAEIERLFGPVDEKHQDVEQV